VKAVFAEFIAMTLFVWVGCGTAVSSQAILAFNPQATIDNSFLTAVALAFGFAISVLVYTVAPISGGHLNPAVTFGFVLLGDLTPMMGVFYTLAQCAGATLGAAIVWGSAISDTLTDQVNGDDKPPFLLGMNSVHPDLNIGSAFLGEFMGTFLLVWTVMMVAVSHKSIAGNLAPIAIGWSVFLAHLVLVPLTGCGINPARSLGPMLVVIMADDKAGFEGWWVYYTAPFAGAAAATFICKYLFGVYGDVHEKANNALPEDNTSEDDAVVTDSKLGEHAVEIDDKFQDE
jgi:MIP family channel proteins